MEIPEDSAARFQKQAQARGLTVDRWLLELAEQNTMVSRCAAHSKYTFSRDPSLGP